MSRHPAHWQRTADASRTACGRAVTPGMTVVHHSPGWVTCERCRPAADAFASQAERERRERMEADEAAGIRYNERLTEMYRLDRVLDRTSSGKQQRDAAAGYVAEVGLELCREMVDATEPAWWPTSFARRLLRREVDRQSAARSDAPAAEGAE